MIRIGRSVNVPTIDLRGVLASVPNNQLLADLGGPDLGGRPLGRPDDTPDKPQSNQGTGFIIVRLDQEVSTSLASSEADTLSKFAKEAGLDGLTATLEEFDLVQSWPVVRSVSAKTVLELEARARQTDLPPLRSLTSYWKVDARAHGAGIEKLVAALRKTPGVEHAYLDLVTDDPLVDASDDTYAAQQGYLDPAPDGIDARWAWTQTNGEGAGIAVIDLEQGWFLTHEDYTTKAPTILVGDNRDGVGTYVGNHGTAVLGEMIADDNTTGVVGAAPAAGPVNCVSHYDSVTNTNGNVANAVVGAIVNLSVGDALVLEVQTNFLPTEIIDDNFDAIRLASALGIMVFEAAGNGANNLDTFTDPGGAGQILNRTSPNFRESGAIMVGASVDEVPHERWAFSNFGSRIDCFAWGEGVVTCGYGTLDAGTGNDSTYASSFGGTSSATPIVTGAGLIIQGMHEANTGNRLSPMQMRTILSNPATGTAQGGTVAGNIGVMPDLRAIIEDTLGLTADVYLRDNVGDDGTVPSTGGISASPDIIVRPTAVADPNGSFGEGSGAENSTTLGFSVEAGQDNFVYCRMKNRGATVADQVGVDVYWSEVSTLVTPDMWNLIGTTNPVDVPVGDTLVVTDALTWNDSDIPAPGHYCYVGVAGGADDPAPPLPSPTDWDGFRAFIRNQNNATWRNFNVVDAIADASGDPFIGRFLIANFPDRRRRFDFVINQRLAKGLQAQLEVPLAMLKPFVTGLDVAHKIDRRRNVGIIRLPRSQAMRVHGVMLPAKARFTCRVVIEGVAEKAHPGNLISIGQHFDDQEVGRVSWQFAKKGQRKSGR